MNSNLILRTLTSPFVTPYNDVTKSSVLKQSDVDNNFIYLKSEIIYSAITNGGNVILKKLNGNDITFAVGGSISGDFIPLTGTSTNNGLTGPIEFTSTGITAFRQDIATGNGYYIGIGNSANLSASTSGSHLFFENNEYCELVTKGLISQKYTSLTVGDHDIDVSSWDMTTGYHTGIVFQDAFYVGINGTDPTWQGAIYLTDPEPNFIDMSLVHKQYVDNLLDIKSGLFIITPDGSSVTGGTLVNTASTPTIRITTTKKLKLIHINCDNLGSCGATTGTTSTSMGKSDGDINDCMYQSFASPSPYTLYHDVTNCIAIYTDIALMTGIVNNIQENSFDVVLSLSGSSVSNYRGVWHGITYD